VNVQAEPRFRLQAEDIVKLKTRNAAGEMIPLSSFVTVVSNSGPDRVMHYNGFATAEINGAAAPGFSTGQAQKLMEDLAHRELPKRHELRVDGAHLSADPGGQHHDLHISLVCCWCSWCWPRNMKAWRCRWRSS